MVKTKKVKDKEVTGVTVYRSQSVFAQLLEVPCITLSHTSLHAPHWGTFTDVHTAGIMTPFLLLQHLLPPEFHAPSKLPAATFSGQWGQLPNPASLRPDPPSSSLPHPAALALMNWELGDTQGRLGAPVLLDTSGGPLVLRETLFLHHSPPGGSVKIKLEFFT